MASRRKSNLPVLAQAGKHIDFHTVLPSANLLFLSDFNWLIKAATAPRSELGSTFLQQLALIKRAVDTYEH